MEYCTNFEYEIGAGCLEKEMRLVFIDEGDENEPPRLLHSGGVTLVK